MDAPPKWEDYLRHSSLKIGLHISLSRTMLEMLCAITDGVQWDRSMYHSSLITPDNSLATLRALEKRGFIERKSKEVIAAQVRHHDERFYEWHWYQLTPAGECIAAIAVMAGVFIEADAAINKKSRRA